MKSRGLILPPSDLGEYGRDFYGYERTVLRCVSNPQRVFKDDHAQCDLDFENNVMFNADLDSLKKVDGVAHDLVSMLLVWKFYQRKEVFDVEWKSKINADWYKKMIQPPPPPQNHNSNHPNRKKRQKKI
ncbi:hypothetical protein Tco_1241366 [Tanacetum coccineum]